MKLRLQKLKIVLVVLFAVTFGGQQVALGIGGMDESYCSVPPFLIGGESAPPNIMLSLAIVNSMVYETYLDSTKYISGAQWQGWGQSYYGIFNDTKCYIYNDTGEYFEEIGNALADYSCTGIGSVNETFSGVFLNFASATRQEAIKRVFTGGIWNDKGTGQFEYGDPTTCFRQGHKIWGWPGHVPGGTWQVVEVERFDNSGKSGSACGNKEPTDWNNLQDSELGYLEMTYSLAGGTFCTSNRVIANTGPDECLDPLGPYAGKSPVELSCTTGAPIVETRIDSSCTWCTGLGGVCTAASGIPWYQCTTPSKGKPSSRKHSWCAAGACTNAVAQPACPAPGTYGEEICFDECAVAEPTTVSGTQCTIGGSGTICQCEYSETTCTTTSASSVTRKMVLRIKTDRPEPEGVLEELAGKANWGLMTFVNGGGSNGGKFGARLGSDIDVLEEQVIAAMGTRQGGLAPGLYHTLQYLMYQEEPVSPGKSPITYPWSGGPGTIDDPLNDKDLKCGSLNVFFLTDGTGGNNPTGQFPYNDYDVDAKDTSGWSSTTIPDWPPAVYPDWAHFTATNNKVTYLDDFTYYAHMNDMRPETPEFDPINTYVVYTFGERNDELRYYMWEAGKNGTFKDYNGNGRPDQDFEWDDNKDGVPDGFFLAENGNALRDSILQALLAILERTSSATSFDFIGAHGASSGSLIQSFFNPRKKTGGVEATWVGFLRSFFVDGAGNTREDTDDNFDLESSDKVFTLRYDPNIELTVADLYTWPDLYATAPTDTMTPIKTIPSEDLAALFDAGLILAEMAPSDRKILTNVKFVPNSQIDFSLTNAGQIAPHLGDQVTTAADAALLIEYIRGVDIPGFRPRTVMIGDPPVPLTWKLGDTVYSEALITGKPSLPEVFDGRFNAGNPEDANMETRINFLINEYQDFVSSHVDDHLFMYQGANDGMLHAYTLGTVKAEDRNLVFEGIDSSNDTFTGTDGKSYKVGQEAWGYIPRAALPHLNWLTEEEYCHVYTVDGDPKVRYMQLFPPDSGLYYGGWGRVLIISAKMGCSDIKSGSETYRSSYVFLDITDAYKPKYMFEFSDPDLGHAYLPPLGIRRLVGNDSSAHFEHKFVVFGGPTDLETHERTAPPVFWVITPPSMGVGGWTVERRDLPGTYDGFVATGAVALDIVEPTNAGVVPHTSRADYRPAEIDLWDDVIYAAGYLQNGSNLDGAVLAIDLKRHRGVHKDFPIIEDPYVFDSPTDWRVRGLAYFDEQPVHVMNFSASRAGMYLATGRFMTKDDLTNDTQQSMYFMLDPCMGGESGANAFVSCPALGSDSNTYLFPDPRSTGMDLTSYSSSYDDCAGTRTCSGGSCLTQSEISTKITETYTTYFDFNTPGEHAVSNLIYDGTAGVLIGTYNPSLSDGCSFSGTGSIYSVSLEPKFGECIGSLFQSVGGGVPTISEPVNGRIFVGDDKGGVGTKQTKPRFSGPYFGFGQTLIESWR